MMDRSTLEKRVSECESYLSGLYGQRVRPLLIPASLLFLLSTFSLGLLAFSPVQVGDDWRRLFQIDAPLVVQSGRWLKVVIWEAQGMPHRMHGISLLLSLALMTVSTLLISVLFFPEHRLQSFLFSALIIFHPISTVHLISYTHQFPHALAVTFLSISLFLLQFKSLDFTNSRYADLLVALVSAVFLSLAVSIRQTFLFFWLVVAVSLLLNQRLSRQNLSTVTPNATQVSFSRILMICFASLVLYFFTWILLPPFGSFSDSNHLPGYSVGGTLIQTLPDLEFTFQRFFTYFFKSQFGSSHLWSGFSKGVLLFCLLVLIGRIFIQSKGEVGFLRRLRLVFVNFGLLAFIFLAPWLLSLVRLPANTVRMTALIGLIPIYGCLSYLTLNQVSYLPMRRLIEMLLLLVSFSFLISQNMATNMVYYGNLKDFNTAQSLIHRIEQHENFATFSDSSQQKLFYLGKLRRNRKDNDVSQQFLEGPLGDSMVNWGVFNMMSTQISDIHQLIEYSPPGLDRDYFELSANFHCSSGLKSGDAFGFSFLAALAPEKKQRLLQWESSSRPWPSQSSTLVLDNFAFIKLHENNKGGYFSCLK